MYARGRRVYARMYRCAINLFTIPALRSSAYDHGGHRKTESNMTRRRHYRNTIRDSAGMRGRQFVPKSVRAISSHPITAVRVANLVLYEIISVAIKINIHIRISMPLYLLLPLAAVVSEIKIVIE